VKITDTINKVYDLGNGRQREKSTVLCGLVSSDLLKVQAETGKISTFLGGS